MKKAKSKKKKVQFMSSREFFFHFPSSLLGLLDHPKDSLRAIKELRQNVITLTVVDRETGKLRLKARQIWDAIRRYTVNLWL